MHLEDVQHLRRVLFCLHNSETELITAWS